MIFNHFSQQEQHWILSQVCLKDYFVSVHYHIHLFQSRSVSFLLIRNIYEQNNDSEYKNT